MYRYKILCTTCWSAGMWGSCRYTLGHNKNMHVYIYSYMYT